MPVEKAKIEDHGSRVVATAVALICLDILMIASRFLSRRVGKKVGFWWDDFAALAALPFIIIYCGISIHWTHVGLGRHFVDIESPSSFMLSFYVSGPFYIASLFFTKTSAILFYLRVFKSEGWFLWISSSAIALNIVWAVAIGCISFFPCRPVEKFWNQPLPGMCIDMPAILAAFAVLNVLTDTLILIMPLPMIWQLKISWVRKLGFAVVFVLGYSILALSLTRLVLLFQLGDQLFSDLSWYLERFIILCLLEPGLGIAGLCLPATFQLIRMVFESKQAPTCASSEFFGGPYVDLQSPRSSYKASPKDLSEVSTIEEARVEPVMGRANPTRTRIDAFEPEVPSGHIAFWIKT